MYSIKLIITTLFISCIFLNCKKDDASPKSKEAMLTNGSSKTWKVISRKISGVDTPVQDCEKDNRATFSANKDFSFDYGMQKCNSSESSFSAKWELSPIQDTIYTISSYTVSGLSYSSKVGTKIVELTDSKLTTSFTNTAGGVSVTTETTAVAQ